MTLAECRRGDRLRVVEIDAGRGAALHLLNLGLDVGDTIELLQRSLLRGPVLVRRGATQVAIGHGLAAQILVERVP
jgi:Fur family transcriptional regulator, ferric uptake regulator